MSIFISIASYRDPELVRTIKSAIDNAKNPKDLYFSVMLQEFERFEPDLSWVPNLSLIKIHPKYAKGAGYARAEAMKLYSGQDYYMQIDSHTMFEKQWDIQCIEQFKKAQQIANNEKIILSYFPPPFHVEQNRKISIVKNSKVQLPYPTKQIPKLTKRNEWSAERIEFDNKDNGIPELSTTVLAGFVFTNGSIVDQVPYDPDISFFGEEICFAMRAWTRGWDIYSPKNNIVYHYYSRSTEPKIWKDRNIRKLSWAEIEKSSKEKQIKVLCGIENGIFGAGKERSLNDYERLIGIDFNKFYGLTKSKISSRLG